MTQIFGPRKISQVNQVAIPVDLMRLLGLTPGDSVYFEVVGDTSPEVRLVAASTVATRYEAGRGSELDATVVRTGVPTGRARGRGRSTTTTTPTPGSTESREGSADADR